MKLTGVGHIAEKRDKHTTPISVVLLPGIGDIIYTWYKLIHYVNKGYVFNVKVLDCLPQRSHQILGCLEGMKSFNYIQGVDYSHYWLMNINDLIEPPHFTTYNGMPVLHINSFLETGKHLDEFMPKYKARYDININTNEESIYFVTQNINTDFYNILLYTSSYENNINCKVHPDPKFWADLTNLCYDFNNSEKPLNVYVVGASYDSDLTVDTCNELKKMGVSCEVLIDEAFYHIIDFIKQVDFVIAYESGLAMIADCVKTHLFHIIRCQGGERDDKTFPFLGPINPMGIYKRYWPIFYDESIEDINKKLGAL